MEKNRFEAVGMATKSIRCIDGIKLTTWRKEINSANVLGVEAGTTGPKGGDSGHGGRTYLRIADLGGTDLRCRAYKDQYGSAGVEIILGGDSERTSLMEALRFALNALDPTAIQN